MHMRSMKSREFRDKEKRNVKMLGVMWANVKFSFSLVVGKLSADPVEVELQAVLVHPNMCFFRRHLD